MTASLSLYFTRKLAFHFHMRHTLGMTTYDVHESCPIFKTSHSPRPSTSNILLHTWPWTSNFKWTSPPSLQMITNQLKENIIQGWLFILSFPFFRSAFFFSINSLILSGFPLTFSHLAEASLSAFSCLGGRIFCCSRGNCIFFFQFPFWYIWNSINLASVPQLGYKDLVYDYLFTSERDLD